MTEVGVHAEEMTKNFESFPPAKKMLKFLQTAIAIQTIHTAGHTHQDIKPKNIVLTDPETTDFRLIDFANPVNRRSWR